MFLRSFREFKWLYFPVSCAPLVYYISADYRSLVTIDFYGGSSLGSKMCTVTLYTLNMVKDSLMMTLSSRNMSL